MRKPTLSNKLFFSIISLFLLFAGCFLLFQVRRERTFKKEILDQRLQDYNTYLGEAVGYPPLDSVELKEFLDSHTLENLHVRIVDSSGKVIFDSRFSGVEDYDGGKEIAKARETGSGYKIDRELAAAGKDYFYSATLIPDKGLIIRSSLPYSGSLPSDLKPDKHYLWFAASVFAALACLIYIFSRLAGVLIERMEERDRVHLQKELTQNISHELKTPVAGVKAYLETMLNDPQMPPSVREQFTRCSFALAERLTALVEDLSSLDRMDGNGPATVMEEIDILPLINQIVAETEASFSREKMTLLVDLPDKIPATCNKALAYSIFRNLFDNTLKYAGEGASVELRCSGEGETWKFVFSDTGPGVPRESLPLLFDRFYRVDKGRSRELGGTGLGLSIVKTAIELLGGSISASEVSPHGLAYTFTIPR